ncbi:hypothetical protein ACIPRI_13060 [Variovorax sp. LARHSF232]
MQFDHERKRFLVFEAAGRMALPASGSKKPARDGRRKEKEERGLARSTQTRQRQCVVHIRSKVRGMKLMPRILKAPVQKANE